MLITNISNACLPRCLSVCLSIYLLSQLSWMEQLKSKVLYIYIHIYLCTSEIWQLQLSWALPRALWLPHASQLLSMLLTLGLVGCIFIANYKSPRYLVWNKISLLAAAATAAVQHTRLIRAETCLAPVWLPVCLSPCLIPIAVRQTYLSLMKGIICHACQRQQQQKRKMLWQEFPLGLRTKEKCLRPEQQRGWGRQGEV